MPTPPPDGPSITARKLAMAACAVPAFAAFIVMLLDYKGIINVQEYGVPEAYLYGGCVVVILVAAVAIAVVWRCPGCGVYLGKEFSPSRCPGCGVRFR